jgi:cardiolipin synthase A/B
VRQRRKMMVTLLIAGPRLLGAFASIHAILGVRTAQGAIAWALLLNASPYVAVPAYWVFGQSHFEAT